MNSAGDVNMNMDFQTKLNEYAKTRKNRRKWLTVVASLCAVVAVGTSYLLINPAATQQQETFCGFEEHKEHVDDCHEKVLVCRLPEEGHTHSESCYEEKQVLTCLLPETGGHTHSDTCYGTEEYLSCGLEETDGHQHGEGCYETERVLICNDANEEHEHTDECYEENEVLTCQIKDCEPHHHDETCYSTRQVLICNEEETAPHHHDESCYETQTVCTCGMDECEPHQHSEECYEINYDNLLCKLPIHEHTLQCFSNPEADIETASVWERTFDSVELSGNWGEDVIAIAKTQLGYSESTANYEVQEDGKTMKGYTRYGAWYGNSYGDWCAMFCSFCIHYAGVDESLMPIEQSCSRWVEALHKLKYIHGSDYEPAPGDLVFFDYDDDGRADHVGLVYEVADGKLHTIEGNKGLTVRYCDYEPNDRTILCYGKLPENPELAEKAASKMAPMMLMSMAGNTGNGITWEIKPASDGSYVLHVGGSGAIPADFLAGTADLSDAMTEIMADGNFVSLVIGSGITSVGSNAFNTPAENDTNAIITSVSFENRRIRIQPDGELRVRRLRYRRSV